MVKGSSFVCLDRKSFHHISKYSNCSSGIFLFSRNECDNTARDLSKSGILAVSYHAGLTDQQRVQIQEKWLNGNRCKVGIPCVSNFHCMKTVTFVAVKGDLGLAVLA